MKLILSLLATSLAITSTMSTPSFEIDECEPFIVMYSDIGDNDCFDGQAMQLAINMAKPTLKGWVRAITEETQSGNSGNSNNGNSGNGNSGNSNSGNLNLGDSNSGNSSASLPPNPDAVVSVDSPTSSPISVGSTTATSSPSTAPTTVASSVGTGVKTPVHESESESSDSIMDWFEEAIKYGVLNTTGYESEIDNATMAKLDHAMGYKAGLHDGYTEAVHAGFDGGFKSAITARSGNQQYDDRTLTATVPGEGQVRSPAYMDGYNAGHTIGYDEGYKAAFIHGDIRGRCTDLLNYNSGYDNGLTSPIVPGGGTQRKMLAEIDAVDGSMLPLSQQELDTPQLRGNRHPERKTQLTVSYCKSLCFSSVLSKRQQCAVLGCWTRYPNLTARRRTRRELQDAPPGTDEEIIHDDNFVFQTILSGDGVDGGLDFKNLIADLLAKKCNVAEVGFEVWLLCPDPVATAAFFNSTSSTPP